MLIIRTLIAGIVACVAWTSSWSAPLVRHGSLVVALPVATGWVVCGDTRRTNTVYAGADDETKVFELTKGVAAGATGLRRVNENGSTYFDVVESVKSYQKTTPFDGRREFTEGLAKSLGDAFVATVPRRIWPDVEKVEVSGPSAFTVMLFWTTPTGLPQWSEAAFHLRGGGPRYTSRSTRETVASSNSLRPVVFGNLAVIEELQHGHRESFAEARQAPDVRTFLRERYLWRERTASEAERFARHAIELTSARLPDLEARESNVGPKAECVTVKTGSR